MAASAYDVIPDFGLLYDHVPLYRERADVGFYVQEARSPVLELGCGTGRILIPIARAGHTIVGLDSSTQMLERARVNLAQESADVQRRVTLQQRDMHDFDLAAKFPLIIAPFRVFQHLTTIDAQLRFLDNVRRHLARGARFIFDVFNPRFDMLVRHDGLEHEDTPDTRLPDGRTFRRAYRIARVRWLDQISESELIYYVDGTRYVQAWEMRWFLNAELQNLLARAGFRVAATYGDFARGPLADGAPEQVIVAETV